MKNLLLIFTALCGFLTLASCSSDENIGSDSAAKSAVTVRATLPSQFVTRAISDGLTADKLSYAVYEHGSTTPLFQGQRAETFTSREATLNLTLAIGKTYDFVFWADGEGAPYTFSPADQSVTVDYTKLNACNTELRDAFFGKIENQLITDRATTLTTTLYRPFSQINVATSDYKAFTDAGGTVLQSAFTVEGNIFTTLNLLTGAVSGDAGKVSFTAAALPQENITIEGTEYKWLSMNYVLVGEDKALTQIEATFDNAAKPQIALTSVPVRRNFRTNIYGALLTSASTLKINIDQNYQKPDYDINLTWDGTTVTVPAQQTTANGVVTAATIEQPSELAYIAQHAADYATATITLASDMSLAGKAWTPISDGSRKDAQPVAFTGTFDGNGKTISGLKAVNTVDDHGAGLFGIISGQAVVKNLKLAACDVQAEDAAGAVAGVMLGNATVENCTVTSGSVTAKGSAGGLVGRAYGSTNTIKGCTNNATVSGTQKVGGIVGIASNGGTYAISDCANNGSVSGGSDGVAGIVGFAGTAGTLSNCQNHGSVGSGSERYAAGIVAYHSAGKAITITSCSNTGAIKGNAAAGIYGIVSNVNSATATMTGCTNSGEIVGHELAGGIVVSWDNGTITSCTNSGAVTATGEGVKGNPAYSWTQDGMGVAGGVAAGIAANTEMSQCKGGTASAPIKAMYVGRLIGHVTVGAENMSYLDIDDNSGDDTAIPTIGMMARSSAHGYITVKSGTLHGTPRCGTTSAITINSGAAWDAFPTDTGTRTYTGTVNSFTWTKK